MSSVSVSSKAQACTIALSMLASGSFAANAQTTPPPCDELRVWTDRILGGQTTPNDLGPNPDLWPAAHWTYYLKDLPTAATQAECSSLQIQSNRAEYAHFFCAPGETYVNAYPSASNNTRGYPLNVALLQNVQTPNYLPLQQAGPGSTLALVAAPVARSARPLDLANRQLIGGYVDAITGQPLVKETDLSLPVGSSTFRLIRTYAGDPLGEEVDLLSPVQSPLSSPPDDPTVFDPWIRRIDKPDMLHYAFPGSTFPVDNIGRRPALSRHWDWHGVSWMSSENPLLLVDSQYVEHDPTMPPRCILILDAHHSIPFTMDRSATGGPPSYVAPAWYDALLVRRGYWDSVQQRYRPPAAGEGPDEIDIWLAGRSVKYTFRVAHPPQTQIALPRFVHDAHSGSVIVPPVSAENADASPITVDQPPVVRSTDYHRASGATVKRTFVLAPGVEHGNVRGGGFGAPKYALLRRIADGQGNSVEIEYATETPLSTLSTTSPLGRPECTECLQRSNEIGQIARIQLKEGTNVAWTLQYVYRGFQDWTVDGAGPTQKDDDSRWVRQNAVAFVYVYAGDQSTATGLKTLAPKWFVRSGSQATGPVLASLDEQDAVDWEAAIAAEFGTALPGGWKHRLRFVYEEPNGATDGVVNDLQQGVDTRISDLQAQTKNIFDWGSGAPRGTKRLPVLVRVERSSQLAAAAPVASNTVYTYAISDQTYAGIAHDSDVNIAGLRGSVLSPSPWLVGPKLRGIFRNDDLKRIGEWADSQTLPNVTGSVNQLLSPLAGPETTAGVPARPWNASTAADRFASVVFDWHRNRSDLVAISPWAYSLVNTNGRNQLRISADRIIASGRASVVERVSVGSTSSADAPNEPGKRRTFDIGYFTVAPNGQESHSSVWRAPSAAFGSEAYAWNWNLGSPGSFYTDVDTDWTIGVPFPGSFNNYGIRLPSTCLFPYTWFPGLSAFNATSFGRAEASPLSDEMWMAVVEEHDGSEDGYSKYEYVKDPSAYTSAGRPLQPGARTVFAMNAPGYLLWSKTYDLKTGEQTGDEPVEEFVYKSIPGLSYQFDPTPENAASGDEIARDLFGLRLEQHRTIGWGVAELQSAGDREGLINSFSYASETSKRLTATGVKQGAGTDQGSLPVVKRTLLEFGDGVDENLLVRSASLPNASEGNGNGSPSAENRTWRSYWRTPTDTDKSIVVKESVSWGGSARLRPGGPSYCPFERQYFSEDGLLIARAYGLTSQPAAVIASSAWTPNSTAGSKDLVFVDLYGYDTSGRLRVQIVDVDLNRPSGQMFPGEWSIFPRLNPSGDEIPSIPSGASAAYVRSLPDFAGFDRLATPLHHCFGYRYSPGAPKGYASDAMVSAWGGMPGTYSAANDEVDWILDLAAKPGGLYDFTVERSWVVQLPPGNRKWREYAVAQYAGGVLKPTSSGMVLTFTEPGALTYHQYLSVQRSWVMRWNNVAVPREIPNDPASPFVLDVPNPDVPAFASFTPTERDWSTANIGLASTVPGSAILKTEVTCDDSGRPRNAKMQGQGSQATEQLAQDVAYTDFGLVNKKVSPTGTIERSVTTRLGLTTLEFRGTKDRDEFWGTNDDSNILTPPDDNLMLMRKHRYGSGIHDVRQLTETRHFRTRPTTRPQDATAGPSATPSNEDEYGWRSVRRYDRRMRPVWSETRAERSATNSTEPVLRTEVQWLDNSDRVRFAATFSGDPTNVLGPDLDPSKYNCYRSLSDLGVSASAILSRSYVTGTCEIMSLSETIYNDRGQVEESRAYDTREASGTVYSATRTYFDHENRAVCAISSDGRVTVSVYNAVGQMVSEVVTDQLSNKELERVDQGYTHDGLLEISTRLMRVRNLESQNDTLTVGAAGNAVQQDTLYWYDIDSRKRIATAELGAGVADGVFSNSFPGWEAPIGPSVSVDANGNTITNPWTSPPKWDQTEGRWGIAVAGGGTDVAWTNRAVISAFGYDNVGRENLTRRPNGTALLRTYDGMNRVRLETEQLADGSDGPRRAYVYDKGRLARIVAIRPGAASYLVNDPLYEYRRIGWEVTELVYGSEQRPTQIVDAATMAVVSQSNDWPRGVRFPLPTPQRFCDFNGVGGITVEDIFDYLNAWFALDIAADFDDDGILTPQDIFEFLNCWFNPPVPDTRPVRSGGDVDIEFRYTIDGLVAERIEYLDYQPQTGPGASSIQATRQRTKYDELSRVVEIAASAQQALARLDYVVDAATRLSYAYDGLSRLTSAKSYATSMNESGQLVEHLVSDNSFQMDPWGNLTAEVCKRGSGQGAFAPRIDYSWSLRPISGQSPESNPIAPRLIEMKLPWAGAGTQPEATRPSICFGYGAANSYGDATGRVERIDVRESILGATPPAPNQIASYQFAGSATRVGLSLYGPQVGGGREVCISQSFGPSGTENGLPGLDAFARPRVLQYLRPAGSQQSSPINLWAAQYKYDGSGNRIAEDLWLDPTNVDVAQAAPSDRSWRYQYDKLDRIVSAKSGAPDSTDADDGIAEQFAQAWSLDDIGNWGKWNPDSRPPSFLESTYSPHPIATVRTELPANERSEVIGRTTGPSDANGEWLATTNEVPATYDAAGRMRSDGSYLYQYDLFGRLVQVRDIRLGIQPATDPTIGVTLAPRLVVHYTYDALGRVIRVQRPTPPNADGSHNLEIIDTYHDGVRPVQELRAIAAPSVLAPPMQEISSLHRLPVGVETLAVPSIDQVGSASSPWRLFRDYVHSAEAGAFVDDVLAQRVYVDNAGNPSTTPVTLYHMRDANYNVVGLTDEDGRLVARYGYTPYGRPRWVQLLATALPNGPPGAPSMASLIAAKASRIGHQGLPIERFDAPWESPMGANTASTSGATADLIGGECEFAYHARNRVYSPQFGRFLARDPSGLGLPVVDSLAHGGMIPSALDIMQDINRHFGDGLNTHGAYALSPLLRADPTGLFSVGELGSAMGVQGLIGGIIGGYLNRNGPGGVLAGFGVGFGAGALGGAAGYGAISAFGASASGLYAAIAGGIAGGAVQGGVQGFGDSYFLRGSSFRVALADAAWNTMLGAAFGGVGGAIGYKVITHLRGMQQADDLVFASATTAAGTGLGRAALTPSQLATLIQTASRVENQGLSYAARKLADHAGRHGGRSAWPMPTGNAQAKNELALAVIDDILDRAVKVTQLGRGGKDIRLLDGRGIRVEADGTFFTFVD